MVDKTFDSKMGASAGAGSGSWEVVLMRVGRRRARAKLVGHQVGACRNRKQMESRQRVACPWALVECVLMGVLHPKKDNSWLFNCLG